MGAPHFRAPVTFARTEDGGRKSPAFSGYRPMLNFATWQSYCFNDGQLTFVDQGECEPGATCIADVELAAPEYLPVALCAGLRFQVHEGARRVADAEVVEVFDVPV